MKRHWLILLALVISTTTFSQNAKPEWTKILDDTPASMKLQLVSSSEESIKVHLQVAGFYTTTVTTPKGEASIISVPKSVSTAEAGEPDVPMIGIPAIIGDQARMNVRVVEAKYMDFNNMMVAPSKGDFPRTIDPATVPYTYGDSYNKDAFFPASSAELYEPYILRDYRGQNMSVHPFVYNPVTKTLRVYYDLTVEMYKVDDNGQNPLTSRQSKVVKTDPDFKNLYGRHFINYEATQTKYTPVDEDGDLLIICYDNFISAMTDFVNWKKTRGVNTTIVGTSTVNSSLTYAKLKTYIQNQYNANNNLTHVLLVGDVAQIPGYTYTGASGYEGKGDNAYGQIVGNDLYNDVFIGRFSASSVAQVTTQVNKVITYERDLTTNDTWCQNGLGISTTEGSGGHNGEDDYEHIENLRTDLLNFGYSTVYQDYKNVSGFPSSTTTTISNHINSGVGIINYCNHGEETGWQSHYYMNSNVNALTNSNKLPFIFSVACLVGKYDYSSGDCFAETWMHATKNGALTGAVGGMFSYISQPWVPPMWAQDEFVDILTELKSNNIKRTLGGTAINGLFGIFDNYSTSNASAVGTYQAWILYGDPSLMLRTKTPQAMTVSHEGVVFPGASTYNVTVSNGNGALATITDADHNILGKATVSNGIATITLNGSPAVGSELTLCVFGYNKVTSLSTISVIAPEDPYLSLASYTPNTALVGVDTDLSLTFKNVGTNATTGLTTVTLSSSDNNVTFVDGANTATFDALGADATTTLSGFRFRLNSAVTLGVPVTLHYTAVNGDNTWDGSFSIVSDQIFTVNVAPNNANYGTVSSSDEYNYNAPCTVTATPADGYMFVNWTQNGQVVSTDAVYTFNVTSNANLVANFAEGVVIGSGTTTNEYLPSYNYYKHSLSEQIYTPAELGNAGTITSIAFYNGGAEKTRTLEFYLKATNKNAFSSKTDWIAVSASDKVFSGSVTMVAGAWTTITLDTPFEYDGASNVVLVTDDNSGEWTGSPNMACRVFSTNSNQAIYIYNDDTNYNPLSPPTSSGTYNNVLKVKNQLIITKESSTVACPAPSDLSVSDITNSSAIVSWEGEADSYELQYAKAQKTLSYDFEDGTQGWTLLKGTTGTSPHNWMHNTEYVAYDSNGSQIVPVCHNSSSGMMLSESYISASTPNGSGSAVTPDNYLVSPQIPLGGSITFYAASRMSNYPAEKFSVLVSTTGNSISDFTNTELTVTLTNNSWKEYTVDLSAYSGNGYVAIRHYDCNDQHLLYIDDVTVVGEEMTWTTVNPAASPCTLTNLEPGAEYAVKVKSLCGEDGESKWSTIDFTTFSGLVLADNATNNSTLINTLVNNSDVNKDVMLVGRTLYKDGEWNTLCLPFNVTLADSPLSGATAKTLADATMNNTHVSLTFGEAVTELEAGVPYIIKWEGGDNIVNPEFKNVTISEPVGQTLSFVNGNVKFIGYYNAFDITPDDTDIYYMTAGSTLKHTGVNRTLKACRAYFHFSAEAMKRIQQFVLDFGGDVTTGIISIDNEKLNESGWYTVDGKKLEQQPTRKGLYIHNGVKVVIK